MDRRAAGDDGASDRGEIALQGAAAVEELEHVTLVRLLPLHAVRRVGPDVEPLDVGARHQVERPRVVGGHGRDDQRLADGVDHA